ncbi:outer membrane beta-barrel protein [Pedobacter suwonensis]|uniref:outer membrane beta-barrel protein n=2 Tax=Pedobacter suwonensis TaxID=332999 RepID=UPI003CFF3007
MIMTTNRKHQQQEIGKQRILNNFFTVLLLIGASASAKAQVRNELSDRKWLIEFGGAVGLFTPFQQAKEDKILIGTSSLTAIQFNYKKQFFGRLQVGETRIGFKNKTSYGTVNSDINVAASNLNVGAFVGYHYGLGNWQPFVILGAGPSLIGVPVTSFEPETNTVQYKTDTRTYLHATGGIGVNYSLSRSIMLLLECQATSLPGLPKEPSTHLEGISALINVKISL